MDLLGTWPNVQRAALVNLGDLVTYDITKGMLTREMQWEVCKTLPYLMGPIYNVFFCEGQCDDPIRVQLRGWVRGCPGDGAGRRGQVKGHQPASG